MKTTINSKINWFCLLSLITHHLFGSKNTLKNNYCTISHYTYHTIFLMHFHSQMDRMQPLFNRTKECTFKSYELVKENYQIIKAKLRNLHNFRRDLTAQRVHEIGNLNETVSSYTSRRNSNASNATSEPQEVAPQNVKWVWEWKKKFFFFFFYFNLKK